MVGEAHQKRGEIGIDRAVRWLNYSTRVATIYTNTEKVFGDLLQFDWPHDSQPFSFDIGGKFRGGSLQDKSFMAEVKKYRYEMDSAAAYAKFIAECYVAFQEKPDRCDNLLWLSWAPFQAQAWHKHRTAETIKKHLLHQNNVGRVFGTDSSEEARKQIDEQVVFELRSRLWLVTLCEEQEDLVVTDEHYYRLMYFMGIQESK
jgi:hypothetical protein